MDIQPCAGCGERGFSGQSSIIFIDGELCSEHVGTCRHCQRQRRFVFQLPEGIPTLRGADGGFGGPEPSELLDPGEWLIVAELAASNATDDSDVELAAAAIDEVLKFIPAGADHVPAEAIRSSDGRAVYAREPGRFHRSRLTAVAATYRDLAAQMRQART